MTSFCTVIVGAASGWLCRRNRMPSAVQPGGKYELEKVSIRTRSSRSLFQRSGQGIASERPMGGKHNDAGGDHAEKYDDANPEPSRYRPVRCRRGLFDEHLEVQAIRMPRTRKETVGGRQT